VPTKPISNPASNQAHANIPIARAINDDDDVPPPLLHRRKNAWLKGEADDDLLPPFENQDVDSTTGEDIDPEIGEIKNPATGEDPNTVADPETFDPGGPAMVSDDKVKTPMTTATTQCHLTGLKKRTIISMLATALSTMGGDTRTQSVIHGMESTKRRIHPHKTH
jgi:hypothetical protein